MACPKCGTAKKPGQRSRGCLKCKRDRGKVWYQENKVTHLAHTTRIKRVAVCKARAFVQEIKSNNPCTDCGLKFHWFVMDFDHVGMKRMDVSLLVARGYTIEAIKAELQHCELVCSNCHRLRTWGRSNYGV